jgi:hypothetical protein
LLAGGVPIAGDDNSLAGLIDDGHFGTSTFYITTGTSHPQLGQALGIRLVNLNVVDPAFADSDLEVDFDDVRLVAIAALPGDYNDDGTVDAADYVTWRTNEGAPAGTLPHDIDDQVIGLAQYATWRANFGENSMTGAGNSAAPEPGSECLLFLALGIKLCRSSACRTSVRA